MAASIAYALANITDNQKDNSFYDQLHSVLKKIPSYDISILLTDASCH